MKVTSPIPYPCLNCDGPLYPHTTWDAVYCSKSCKEAAEVRNSLGGRAWYARVRSPRTHSGHGRLVVVRDISLLRGERQALRREAYRLEVPVGDLVLTSSGPYREVIGEAP